MIKKILVSAALCAFSVTSANAVPLTVNFADLADDDTSTSDGTGGIGEKGYQPYIFSFLGSLELTIQGFETSSSGTFESYAYMDENNAGMGVCTNLTESKQCNPSNDDNVSSGEFLRLFFNQDVFIDSLTFNNNHDGGFSNSRINVNGDNLAPGDGKGSKTFSNGWLVNGGSFFDLGYVERDGDDASRSSHFYLEQLVVSKVPEPSSLFLMGAGLLGLGFVRKKRA